MSAEALLPCLVCGSSLENVWEHSVNQPYAGTEFRTEGGYGSTFWDSFDGEELVLNVCDACLTKYSYRLGQQKRYLPVHCEQFAGVGQQVVDRPLVPYTGNPDDTRVLVRIEELGVREDVEWAPDIAEIKAQLEAEYKEENNDPAD